MSKQENSAWLTLKLLGNLGFLIAVPLVVCALIGRLLDKRLDSSPLFLLTGLVFSLIISSIGVYRKTQELLKDLDK